MPWGIKAYIRRRCRNLLLVATTRSVRGACCCLSSAEPAISITPSLTGCPGAEKEHFYKTFVTKQTVIAFLIIDNSRSPLDSSQL